MDTIDAEDNFRADFLSQTHVDFMVAYLELMRQREAAIIDNFLKEKS
jgi:hypothetical protein